VYGQTVHLAIGRALVRGEPADAAVRAAIARTGLAQHARAAIADVARAVAALAALGLPAAATCLRLEYPIAGVAADGALLAGYVDLVAAQPEGVVVLDFKTDAPPTASAPIPASYLAQVGGYAAALERALAATPVRCGLLYTADGEIRWVPR
jgi:ATP-dependent helicase/nuclease subunit A